MKLNTPQILFMNYLFQNDLKTKNFILIILIYRAKVVILRVILKQFKLQNNKILDEFSFFQN